MIQRITSKAYFRYYEYFPINRGKHFIARLLNKAFRRFVLSTIHNFSLCIDISSPSETKFFRGRDEFIEDEILNLNSGQIFIDIGANIGYYSLLAAKNIQPDGKVFSFEPSPREYKKLLFNIQINPFKNIIPVNAALGANNDIVQLSLNKYQTGGNKLVRSSKKNDKTVNSWQMSLDNFFGNQILKVDLIKIDVEGYELNVLEGMKNMLKKGKVNRLIIEITDSFLKQNGHSSKELYDFMEKLRYVPKHGQKDHWQYDELFEYNPK